MIPEDVHVFPINTPNKKLTDCKQLLAAEKSLGVLEAEERSTEYGEGYKKVLRQRAAECRLLINKLRREYGLE